MRAPARPSRGKAAPNASRNRTSRAHLQAASLLIRPPSRTAGPPPRNTGVAGAAATVTAAMVLTRSSGAGGTPVASVAPTLPGDNRRGGKGVAGPGHHLRDGAGEPRLSVAGLGERAVGARPVSPDPAPRLLTAA